MRCRLGMIGLLGLVPLSVVLGWWLLPEPHITEVNCERIRDGMTSSEVEAILGECPRYEEENNNVYGTWQESGRMIVVSFFDDRVFWAHYMEFTAWERIEMGYRRLFGPR